MAYFILVPEATLLLVGTKIRDSGNVQFSELAKSDRLVFLTLSMRRMTGNSRTSGVGTSQRFPEVAILGADQKERGLWGGECETTGKLSVSEMPKISFQKSLNDLSSTDFYAE